MTNASGRRETLLDPVKVRFTADDKAALMAASAALGTSVSEVVRLAVKAMAERPDGPAHHVLASASSAPDRTAYGAYAEAANARARQLQKIGVNVNQIARRLNAGNRVDDAVAAVLADVRRELRRLGSQDDDEARRIVAKRGAWR